MNRAEQLIEQVHAVGGEIRVQGDRLKLRAPKPLPDPLMASLAEYKADIIEVLDEESQIYEWLRQNPPAPNDSDVCAECGKEISDGPIAIVAHFSTEPGQHAWFHAECYRTWEASRKALARKVLGLDG